MQIKTNRFSGIYLRMALLTVVVCTVLRVVLLFNEQTSELGFSFGEWIAAFGLGAINDLAALTIGFGFMWLYLVTLSNRKFERPWGWILLALLTGAFLYVSLFNTIFDEYGSVAPQVASIVLGYWAASFALRMFAVRIRPLWSKVWFTLLLLVYVGTILFNAVSEFYFWNEFGVRYNFIAVDYLVYTNEVIGNIMESYPILPLVSLLLVSTVGITWWLFRRDIAATEEFKSSGWKLVTTPVYIAAALASVWLLGFNTRFQTSDNIYYNELQANGVYKFYEAFKNNELSFDRFYRTLPAEEAVALVNAEYGSGDHNLRRIVTEAEEQHRNIVLVTLESMSASFMGRYGDTRGLTPYLDSLCNRSLVFDNLFATGNRTVRGLEAVTLSLPPCPGQSIIKQANNGNMNSTGKILKEKGYDVLYFYGGNSYFDNMETFFGGNGYRIVDQKQYTPEEITFQNIWGVCDEDSYAKAIRTLSEISEEGRPFFAHIMSVSNHRPYTYPAGRIPIANDLQSREGGVMYSDYSLGKFLEEAARQPWFANTVFVITADHCASSAGKTELPLEKYHIPAMIYAPGFVPTGQIDKLSSQIDLMPTLFSMLGFDYDSHFYGRDILSDDFRERAFVATYQSLGYFEPGVLTIQSPVNRLEQFSVNKNPDATYTLSPVATPDEEQLKRAISLYQTSNMWNKR